MSVKKPPEYIVAALAARQDGVFTAAQATKSGLSRKQLRARVRAGVWVEEYPDVLRSAAAPKTPRMTVRAALLFAGSEALVARRSAGEWWGLDGVRARYPEVLLPYERHRSAQGLVVLRSSKLRADDSAFHRGLPITSVERTLIDLAAVLDDVRLETAIESARRQRLTTLAALGGRFDSLRGSGRAGAPRVRRVLDVLDPRAAAEFPLEVLVANLLRSAGLPRPVLQHWICVNGVRYRVDFAWPEVRLILECDGRAYHPDFERDRVRWSDLAADGWRILFATWREATRTPEVIVERVKVALADS
jgi:Transcriptional regulator, AbiEi antitoxin/Protein of unknown function (DUF559)